MPAPQFTFDDVKDAVAIVTAFNLPNAADQTVCANETWSNRAVNGGFAKAFGDALSGLGLDAELVKNLSKRFEAELREASRERKRLEDEAQKAADKAAEDAVREKEAIATIAESSKHHRDEIRRLYTEAKTAVSDLSDNGIAIPPDVTRLLNEVKTRSDAVGTDWGEVRDAASKTLAEQKARALERFFEQTSDKSGEITDWVNQFRSLDQLVEDARQSRTRTKGLLEAAATKAKPARAAFTEANALEKPKSLMATILRKPAPLDPLKTALLNANQTLTNHFGELRQANTDAGTALTSAEDALTRASRRDARVALKAAQAAEEKAKTSDGKIDAAVTAVSNAATKWKEETEKKSAAPFTWWAIGILGASLIGLFVEYMIISRSVPESWRWLAWIPSVLFAIMGTGAFFIYRGWTPRVVSAHVTFHLIAIFIIVVLRSNAPGVEMITTTPEPTRTQEEAAETFEAIFVPYPTHTPTPPQN